MGYGYFDEENREYVITNPRTPVKWINYIGTLAFGGFVDHTGGALLCKGDPALNRITKYIPQLPDGDMKGSTLYLRVHTAQGYEVLSPFFVPGLHAMQHYACHVGLGYSHIVSQVQDIQTEVTIFVPQGEAVELRLITIVNQSEAPITLDAIPLVEYSHFDALAQFTNADWVPQTMTSRVHQQLEGRLVLSQYAFMHRDLRQNYFTASLPVDSFETDRRAFLGDNGYRTWADPASLADDHLGNHQANRGDTIAALLLPLGTLQPKESITFVTQLGQTDELHNLSERVKKYYSHEAADAALKDIKEEWDTYLSRTQVQTPDNSLNLMLNVFNPRQTFITKNWSRYLSLYQLGFGARGIGFRDTSQDLLGVVNFMPDEVKKQARILLSMQSENGSAKHQFNPITLVANEGDSREDEDRPSFYSDDHLWVVLAITEYLKETGDFDFLDEAIPFYEKGTDGLPLESGTVLAHLNRALAFTHETTGQQGLPLLGFADWNDTVNLPSGAESVFTACLFGKALLDMIDLLVHLGNKELVQQYRAWHTDIAALVNSIAWDGKWYHRYYMPSGEPIGSCKNDKGKIFSNAQSWAVIAGFASPERAQIALDSVRTHLNTRHGIKLSTPGYDGYDAEIGGVTTYPPGAKENGGIFLHANPWVMIAETMLGRGEYAHEYYSQINPAIKNKTMNVFECEPYVYPQNILGDEHPQFGLARNSWLTGTASWAYQAGLKYILGVRPEYDGLRIDPCIPADWGEFKVTRKIRGAEYEIVVNNAAGVEGGVAALKINGKLIKGNIVPYATAGEVVHVQIDLGS